MMPAIAVSAAFVDSPHRPQPDFGVKLDRRVRRCDKLVVEADLPRRCRETPISFIAGGRRLCVRAAEPVEEQRDGKTFFSVEVTGRTKHPHGAGLHYTLVTDTGAVSGHSALFLNWPIRHYRSGDCR